MGRCILKDSCMTCFICFSKIGKPFFSYEERIEKKMRLRSYYKCKICDYTFLDPSQRLSGREEKIRYLKHKNNVQDLRYLRFLSHLYECSFKKAHKSILDFGCGPTEGMKALNSKIESYDPFFFNNPEKLKKKYDLILCSEVVEHFYNPSKEFQRLKGMLNKGGVLALRTGVLSEERKFQRWSYRKDITHVGFFQTKTFKYLADRWSWTLEEPNPSVFVFHEGF